jgi:integrase
VARPRKSDRHLPPCVYHRRGRYYHVVAKKWHPLGPDLPAALAEYARRIQPAPQASGNWARLVDEAMIEICARVKASTAEQYRTAADILREAFAEFEPDQLRPVHIKTLLRGMKDRAGMANRCLSVLRGVLDYALDLELITDNPARAVQRLPQRPRDRLITPHEYAAIYAAAADRLQVVMDLCYLTGQRIGDVLSIRHEHVQPDGSIEFVQQKTGQKMIVHNPELAAVVARARTLRGKITSAWLIQGKRGRQADYRAIRDQWDAACERARVDDAHLHDLRAMAITAARQQGEDPTALAGHRHSGTTIRYLRDKAPVEANGPSFGQVQNSRQKG